MRTNGTHEVIARIAGPGFVLAAVFALALSGSSVARAQASATSPAKAAPAAQTVQPAVPANRQSGGTHEGIKVHGHWMIEVREPGGKLISHTEFENSLFGPGGAAILPMLFTATETGGFAYTPGEWGVLLGDPSSPPCSAGLNYPFKDINLANPILAFTPFVGGVCALAQLAPPAAIYPGNCSPAPNSGCSYNLQVGQNTQGNLTLTGSVVSSSAGTISQVQTLLSTCSGKIAPAACPTETSPDDLSPIGGDYVLAFTAATLPQSGGATPCGGTGQISCAVTVPAAGDTINVSVTISFQ
jgi:hypothetical protein